MATKRPSGIVRSMRRLELLPAGEFGKFFDDHLGHLLLAVAVGVFRGSEVGRAVIDPPRNVGHGRIGKLLDHLCDTIHRVGRVYDAQEGKLATPGRAQLLDQCAVARDVLLLGGVWRGAEVVRAERDDDRIGTVGARRKDPGRGGILVKDTEGARTHRGLRNG